MLNQMLNTHPRTDRAILGQYTVYIIYGSDRRQRTIWNDIWATKIFNAVVNMDKKS